MIRTRVLSAAALVAVAGAGAGCGSSSSSSSSAPATTADAAPVASRTHALTLTTRNMKFSSSALSAKAGKLTLRLKNADSMEHEVVLIRTNKAPGKLPTSGGKASEKGSVGEIEDVAPGKTGSRTFTLKAGRYVFICNVPGHYASGMYGKLTVR